HRWFRAVHLAATLFVVARAWTGLPCPFSVAEDALRANISGTSVLASPFHNSLHRLAFRGKDPREFARAATLFGAIVVAAFVLHRVTRSRASVARGVARDLAGARANSFS